MTRIIRELKERGILKELVPNHISAKKRQRQRLHAIRKPKDYGISWVEDLVQSDTLDVMPLPGVLLKHFTIRDVFSRWNTVSIYSRAMTNTALRKELLEWEQVHNTVRPHQALGYLTPLKFLEH